jgi:diacylglycerol kinase (ATP)
VQVVPRTVAIVNPVAGGGRAAARWKLVEESLTRAGVRSQTVTTERRGHALELSRSALKAGARTLIAVGGDGTVHEVVNGLLDGENVSSDVQVAVVPAGTGMDFLRNTGASRDPRVIAAHILSETERRIDLGLVCGTQTTVFVNFAEIGLGASVVTRSEAHHPRIPGKTSYLLAAVAAALSERNSDFVIKVDGVEVFRGAGVSAIIANGPYAGAGMQIAPQARMDSGRLELTLLGDFSRAELLAHIWKIYPGTHVNLKKVLCWHGTNFEIVSSASSRLDLDGELYPPGAHRIRVLPRVLRVIV